MVAIDNFTPRQVGIVPILSSYIAHRREVILARSRFDKEKAEKRLHIVEGLIRVISILDEVIALIRASENKEMCIRDRWNCWCDSRYPQSLSRYVRGYCDHHDELHCIVCGKCLYSCLSERYYAKSVSYTHLSY